MNQTELFVANNLEKLIKQSGMTKKAVAELKGVTPETLSRHMHGKIQLTLHDAEEYARILNTNAYEILFAAKPMPIIGKCHVHADGLFTRKFYDEPVGHAYLPSNFVENIGCVTWTVDKEYIGPWMTWQNAMQMFDLTGYINKSVPENCVTELCVMETEDTVNFAGYDTNYLAGILYPEPGNRFTVFNTAGDAKNNRDPDAATLRHLKIKWAAPVISTIYRPDLRKCEIIWKDNVKNS